MIALLASDSAAFLANQQRNKLPNNAAPYSLAANIPPSLNVAPNIENSLSGMARHRIPKARQTNALITIRFLKFISPSLIVIIYMIFYNQNNLLYMNKQNILFLHWIFFCEHKCIT